MKLIKWSLAVLLICFICYKVDYLFAASSKIKAATTFVDCPIIDESLLTIVQPDCGANNGRIAGINVISSGTKITYKWRNANGDIVGTMKDLTDIGVDSYQLEVTDNSGCRNTVYSSEFKVTALNGITLDESKAVITPASCDKLGAITGIKVIGADKYTWQETITGVTYTSTTTPDLLSAPAGYYKLTTSNGTNTCRAISDLYAINGDFVLPAVLNYSLDPPPVCGSKVNITVTLSTQNDGPQLYYFWKDSSGRVVDNNMLVKGISPIQVKLLGVLTGKYDLYIQSDKHCPALAGSFFIPFTRFEIDSANSQVYNDACNQHLGAIVPAFKGMPPGPPPLYTWYDSTGKVISQSKSIFRVGKGDYFLYVQVGNCAAGADFVLKDDSPELVPPVAEGSTICLPGLVGIKATNSDTAGIYRLYANENDTMPLDSSITGEFYKNVSKTTNFYIARAHGRCESPRTKVTETVLAALNIPNAFTPNSDGSNDIWQVSGIEDFPEAEIKVFDRYGRNVYQSIGYSTPFNGYNTGKRLAQGTYYYIIDTKQFICSGKIAGSVTILY